MARKLKEPKVKVGDRIGKLVVVEKVDMPVKRRQKDENGNIHEIDTGKTKIGWRCKCDCGGRIILSETTLLKERITLRSCDNCEPEENPNYIPKDMTYEENQEFKELYKYVKKNIFNYNDSQNLPDSIIMRLKGLAKGKYYSGKRTVNNANYTYKTVLNTFKLCSANIQKALRTNNFKDEQHKFNYIAKMIENNINDIYIRMQNAEKSRKEVENTDVSNVLGYVNTFKKEENKKVNKRLEELW